MARPVDLSVDLVPDGAESLCSQDRVRPGRRQDEGRREWERVVGVEVDTPVDVAGGNLLSDDSEESTAILWKVLVFWDVVRLLRVCSVLELAEESNEIFFLNISESPLGDKVKI